MAGLVHHFLRLSLAKVSSHFLRGIPCCGLTPKPEAKTAARKTPTHAAKKGGRNTARRTPEKKGQQGGERWREPAAQLPTKEREQRQIWRVNEACSLSWLDRLVISSI